MEERRPGLAWLRGNSSLERTNLRPSYQRDACRGEGGRKREKVRGVGGGES